MKLTVSLVAFAVQTAAFAAPPPPGFLDQVGKHFSAWDLDHSGELSLAELDKALANPEFKGESAAAAVALKRGVKDRTATYALSAIQEQAAKAPPAGKADTDYGKLYIWALERITKADRSLFATQPPQIDSIRQGKIGDCFCLAALRTVIQRDPQAIVQMIQPQPDGSYKVKIGNQTVATPPLTDGEIAIGASSNNGLWPLVYEKAVGISRMKADAPDATPLNVATKGGSAGSMMSTLTGKEIKRWSCKTWRDAPPDQQPAMLDDVRQQLQRAFAEKRLVTGGTGLLTRGKKGPPGILFNHGYAVLGYDANKDEVHLWNPHGTDFAPKGEPGLHNGFATTKGEFRVPLTQLVKFFGGFAFEQNEAVKKEPKEEPNEK